MKLLSLAFFVLCSVVLQAGILTVSNNPTIPAQNTTLADAVAAVNYILASPLNYDCKSQSIGVG